MSEKSHSSFGSEHQLAGEPLSVRWPFDGSKLLSHSARCPCLFVTGGARTRWNLGDEASTSLDTTGRGSPTIEVPRRCIRPGNSQRLNGPGRGRHIERGPSGLHETKTIQRDRKGHPCPRTRPSGRAKETNLARALIISALPGILSHSSQDRNASPRKAGGAVNIKQSKEQQRKTGRPGPGVRDLSQIAFARY